MKSQNSSPLLPYESVKNWHISLKFLKLIFPSLTHFSKISEINIPILHFPFSIARCNNVPPPPINNTLAGGNHYSDWKSLQSKYSKVFSSGMKSICVANKWYSRIYLSFRAIQGIRVSIERKMTRLSRVLIPAGNHSEGLPRRHKRDAQTFMRSEGRTKLVRKAKREICLKRLFL